MQKISVYQNNIPKKSKNFDIFLEYAEKKEKFKHISKVAV